MKMNRKVGALLVLAAGYSPVMGCGGSMAGAPPRAAEAQTTSADTVGEGESEMVAEPGQEEWDSLLSMDSQLEETFELANVDCDSARDLSQSICELAGRVCEIAEETSDPTTAERCEDGQARCSRAQDRTSNVCP